MKKLIKNGTIVSAEKTFKGDILIDGSVISQIEDNIDVIDAAEIIDASGLYIMPGGVDVHTHLNLALGERHVSDGIYAGTVAAAFGGNTTVVDHPEAGPLGCQLKHQPEYYKGLFSKEAVIDYGIHGVFQHVNDDVLGEISELIAQGHSSMKVYTTYDNMLSEDEIAQVLAEMKKHGGITAFHAEVDAPIKALKQKFGDENKLLPIYHAKSRPDTSEADAISMILGKASEVDVPVYIVHLSSGKGLKVIKAAQDKGQQVITETCPQYLLLDDSFYEKEDGIKYIMAPPLRKAEDNDLLWQGLIDGNIDVVATDHCSFSYADKIKFGKNDFRAVPGGSPGVETRLPLLFSEGVVKGRFNINRFVELAATNPAKIMGIYPKKGCLDKGSDADIILWDDQLTKKISCKNLHQKCDYTPFEGFEVTGWPVMTMLRGKVIIKDGEFKGKKGAGEYILRKPFQ